ncbi:MAG: metalloprotease TldD [Bryobacteraceae bacterium]|nr:metalloprotease TldD [Bryobacteraceae bacterium]MDW8379982.1 metalloprotease TldD [Bryobacterales bacterium]
MALGNCIFASKFGLTEVDLERYLGEALSAGGDYADLYFEYVATTAVSLEESIVKSATQGVTMGVGVRVVAGERTGYAYSDDLSPERIIKAARVAACIARGPSKAVIAGFEQAKKRDLYSVAALASDASLQERIELVQRADRAARAYDPRVFQVIASYSDSVRHVLVATSEGLWSSDVQPMVRMGVTVLARKQGGNPEQGYHGGGGRYNLDYFLREKTPEYFAREAARQAIVQLDAVDAPAGEMTVVLGPGWPGILLHEAVGHGLEADFNRKGVSAFSNRLGEQVASPLCTVVDDGTIANRRGSLNMDDEGTPTQQTVLIEKGVLRGYLQDKLSSRILGTATTGNGRRESYKHIPMPRMTNTFLLAGESDPQEIVRSVKKGLYCATFGGGQVDITSGNFVFSATESYWIEDGKLTRPVRGATLIGNGPEALRYVSMVGSDLQLDEGMGICGKEGQSVPVGVGIPTVKIDRMTVGGTAA